MRLAILLAALAPSACSPSAATAAGGDAAGAASSDGGPCTAPPDQRPDGGTCVLEVKGTVGDLGGAPLGNLIMTFCGSICWGTRSDDAGVFSIPVGDFVDTENYAIHADGRPDHAVDYLRLAKGAPRTVSATMHLPLLPPSNVTLPADGALASTVTVADVTLSIADGTKFDLDIGDCENADAGGRTLRVAAVPLASAPAYALSANVDAIYALSPSGAKSFVGTSGGCVPPPGTKSPIKMGVTLINSAALPASAAVDLLVLGDDYFSVPPNVGTLSVAAAAHVSADAKTIQTDPGEGISELTWLAVRRKGK
jgi:hypothetical protein